MSESSPQPPDDLDALFASARARPLDTSRAQYGFETRLMARLRDRRQPDAGSLWSMVTWRMIPFFEACMVALALWNSQIVAETEDASSVSYLQNPQPSDLLGDLN